MMFTLPDSMAKEIRNGDDFLMRVKLAEITEQLPLRFALPFVALVYAIGFYGFSQVCTLADAHCSGGSTTLLYLNNALRSFGLFFAAPEIGGEGISNPWLMFARWIAPLITIFALSRAFSSRVMEKWNQRKALQSKRHIVILGEGAAAKDLLPKRRRIVSLAHEPMAAMPGYDFISISGHPDNPSRAGVARAKNILILGENDAENLAMHHAVVPLAAAHAKVTLRISSPVLAARLAAENHFMKTPKGAEVTVINLEQLSAKRFVQNENLNEAADLRKLDQAHLAIVGWTVFAEAALEHFVRQSPYRTLGHPMISVFCENPTVAQASLLARLPALADGDLAKLKFYEAIDVPSSAQIAAAEKQGPVSTIVVSNKADDVAATLAFGLRRATRFSGHWQAPIYVRLEKLPLIGEMLKADYAQSAYPAQQIIPIGHGATALLPQDVFGDNDELAKAFHEAYLAEKPGNGPAHKPWSELTQTYRNANRAVADQAWARVHSSGYRASATGAWTIDQNPAKFEALAETIHRLWMIDRRLDGWRFGKVRDNQRRLHPDLCAYAKLPEDVKERDRAQIRLQQAVFVRDKINVREEVTVALFANSVQKTSGDFIDSLRGKFVTLVSEFKTDAETSIAHELSTALQNQIRIYSFGAVPVVKNAEHLHIQGEAKIWIANRADIILTDTKFATKTNAKIWELSA
jgi:RyR domain